MWYARVCHAECDKQGLLTLARKTECEEEEEEDK